MEQITTHTTKEFHPLVLRFFKELNEDLDVKLHPELCPAMIKILEARLKKQTKGTKYEGDFD